MDKRYRQSSSAQQAEARLAVYQQIAEHPGMPLADALKLLRTGLRLTRPEIARLTGLSVRYLQAIEHGEANPSLSMVTQLLAPFGLRLGVALID